jgi:predicted N-formylglutamate amidohydrolase
LRSQFISARTSQLVRVLQTHRGWDAGTLELARALVKRMGERTEFVHSNISRLVIDLNRSPDNPERWSRFTRGLSERERAHIERLHYWPYRSRVAGFVRRHARPGCRVAHLSVHSFTPVLCGVRRTTDFGVLFDPARPSERLLSVRLRTELAARLPGLRIDFNRPYRGTADGLTTYLRSFHEDSQYVGIELEVNQRLVRRPAGSWAAVRAKIVSGCAAALLANNHPEFTG